MTWGKARFDFSDKILDMIVSLRHFLGWMVNAFRSREGLVLENLALRRQLLALHAQRPRRRLTALHKLFWVALRTSWSGRRKPLLLITPRTVVNWHHAGFRLYWAWVSRFRRVGGRKHIGKEVRALIFRMVAESPTWGAPRIHGELLKLGFEVSERSVSRWIRQAPRDLDPVKRWLTFLRNHREAIAAMDFFTVPTLTFGVLYCFFVIGHDRRKILNFNVTRNPHAGSEPTRTVFRSPWQSGVAERWVGSRRRDLLDHVIIMNERHLKRLMSSYLLYYHEDRTHLGLAKDAPAGRPTAIRSERERNIQSFPRLGGLHHRYAVTA
jgi:putative transposase